MSLAASFLHRWVEPNPAARVWFFASRSRYQLFPTQDLLDRLSATRQRLRAIEEYEAAAYLFGPEDPPGVERGP